MKLYTPTRRGSRKKAIQENADQIKAKSLIIRP
nr:MAG TPA: hypothetical protein [Caudoviricetes sp.]DAY74022.1 MAG TPA: hypothetical protein [Caudoviricetes sp.]